MIFVDSNVLIDVIENTSDWHRWSGEQIASASGQDTLVVNALVAAECAPRFESLETLNSMLEELGIAIEELPLEAAFAAGRLFRRYRRAAPDRTRVLADFIIGAHAEFLGAALLTRDVRLYRAYFPDLTLITPENHNG